MYDTILVPIDGSDESYSAAEEAVELVAADGVLHALFVIEELPMYRRSGKAGKFDEGDPERHDRAEAAIERASTLADEAGIDCETAILEGVPSREIVDYAESIDADAIVLGKRGLSAAASDMLGSTTERVIRSADTTVVSVPC
ncbi:universal stress protein UspA [Halalkaliarchaeum desulfuricum]|uniref:Universal stress protein UspA n=1 Tax=Halalkaliarchaeum desulfuricum TaxID=2055893 RepID=A0A343TMY7_9EURY|nr:universal stress protein [Halalkaliarchaeum desulfuricum]AUX10459.1 universal stress protein UspA [Halalkaliarchaeum desulfuricum]